MDKIDWPSMLLQASFETRRYGDQIPEYNMRYIKLGDWIANRINRQLAAGRLAQRQVLDMKAEAYSFIFPFPICEDQITGSTFAARSILAAGDIQEEE